MTTTETSATVTPTIALRRIERAHRWTVAPAEIARYLNGGGRRPLAVAS